MTNTKTPEKPNPAKRPSNVNWARVEAIAGPEGKWRRVEDKAKPTAPQLKK